MFAAAWCVLKFYGQTLALPAMSNTADVFMCFWLMFHYSVTHLRDLEFSGWVLVLMLSATVWRIALWLHTHPEYMVRAMLWQAA